ncbi:recombinase family protein, partial [Paracoccus rhizosphaerae]
MNQHTFPAAPRRVALYARYSTDMQRGESIEDQFRQAERHARQRGWTVVARYSDGAVSGSLSRAREGFVDLSHALASGTFDIVLAESTDRISRDPEHMVRFYKTASFNGVEIHTTGRGKVDVLTLGLSSTMAAIYLEDLAFKTRRGLEGRIEKGMSGGGRSYGYRQGMDARGVPVTGLLEIDQVQAGIIRRIFRDNATGASPLKIAATLNAEGIPSPSVGTKRKSSGHWKQNTINGNAARGTGILNNELYIGRLVWNRLTYSKNPDTERRVSRLNPVGEWQVAVTLPPTFIQRERDSGFGFCLF